MKRPLIWAVVGLFATLSACTGSGVGNAGSGAGAAGGQASGGTSGTGGASGGGDGGQAGSGGAGGGAGSAGAGGGGAGGSDGGGGSTAPVPPSCAPGGPGMTDCGPGESCCTSLVVTGGTYYRTYRNNGGGPTGENDPATVSEFRLDKYLVTVGRYRQFASAWASGWRPAAGSGKHDHLTGGGLANTAGGVETGWDASWTTTANVNPTTASLTRGSFCDSTHATWTASPTGGHENLPINCVSWYESYAFCIWDGAFLPSEAEWEYAAAGGAEQRQYPWGTAAPGTMNQYAIYGSNYTGNATGLAPVGTAASGAGLWGQLDLAGEVWEWNLDWRQAYVNPCTDCVNLTPASFRLVRGDNFGGSLANLVPTVRGGDVAPEGRDSNFGVRCARAP
jgi:formylglycine-generating enzyme required for sulfatase activity